MDLASPTRTPEEWDLSTHELLSTRWSRVEADLTAFVSALTPERLRANLDFHDTRGVRYSSPLWQLMHHLVNHGSYHRGQVVTMLRQLGTEAVSTDLVLFHRERTATG